MSHISDDEDYRFQMPVAIYGYEQPVHGGGRTFAWGPKTVQVRQAVRLRLVNVGPATRLQVAGQLGYPVCTVCGQSRSPLASQRDLQEFRDNHAEQCRKRVENIEFYADVVVDALSIVGCKDRTEAHSVAEAIRVGSVQVFDMELEDLLPMAIGRQGDASTDVLLFDPMPGGSGLLDRIASRWDEVVSAAKNAMDNCASACQESCVDCLQTFRNAYYHRHLNRHVALARLHDWGTSLQFSNPIPARLPAVPPPQFGVNAAEETLRTMLDRAGLHGYQTQFRIDLGPPLGNTVPDFFYSDPEGLDPGICIYLDGLSEHLHGNPATAAQDRRLREQLRAMHYQVIEIPFGHLTDRDQMSRHFFVIGRDLVGTDQARTIRSDPSWFEAPSGNESPEKDDWESVLGLLDSRWHSVAEALRAADITAPQDVDWDIPIAGRVSGQRALMMWDSDAGPVLLVENTLDSSSGIRFVRVQQPTEQLTAALKALLRQ